jgi:hypothetical protein
MGWRHHADVGLLEPECAGITFTYGRSELPRDDAIVLDEPELRLPRPSVTSRVSGNLSEVLARTRPLPRSTVTLRSLPSGRTTVIS